MYVHESLDKVHVLYVKNVGLTYNLKCTLLYVYMYIGGESVRCRNKEM